MTADNDPLWTVYHRTAVFRQYLAAFLVNINAFSFGTVMGWMSPMEPLLISENPPVGTEPISDEYVSWLGSINSIGSLCGCFFWGISSDHLGRKHTAIIIAIPILVGWIFILTAQNAWWLLVARFIIGIGCSGVMINNPIYVTETAEDEIRGKICTFSSIFLRAGWVFSYIVGTFTSYHTFAAVCLFIPLTFLVTFMCMPETPVFLGTIGQYNESYKSLLWFRGGDIVKTIDEIEKQNYQTQRSYRNVWFSDLFKTNGVRKAVIISVVLSIGQILSGELVISTYTVRIFEESGSSFSPYTCMMVIGLLELFFVIISSLFVDHVGRRVLLLTSALVMTVSLSIQATYLYYKNESLDPSFRVIPIVCISITVIFYALGVGPVSIVIISEIFPPYIRGFAVANIQLLRNLLTFICIKTFPYLTRGLGFHGCFFFYAAVCASSSVFIFRMVPETKGKSVQTILKEINGEDDNSCDDSEYRELLQRDLT